MEYQPLASFDHWHDLPSDIQQDVLLKLPIRDLLNVTSSNKLMLEKINKNYLLWRTLYSRRAGANQQNVNFDLKIPNEALGWKILFRNMYEKAHLWTCNLCHGFPIDGYAYKCMYCEDFKCCHTCYEKHGHFINHVVLKYYNRLGSSGVNCKSDDGNRIHLVKPKCGKCQVNLDYPTNRSATDPQLYLCDTCLKDSEFAHHKIYRITEREVVLEDIESNLSEKDMLLKCIECDKSYKVADDHPHVCLTCRNPGNSGNLCTTCHSSSDVMAKHQGHNIVPRPAPNYHACLCDICRWSMRYGIRYRCSVCYDYDLCEFCEPIAIKHNDGRHPMMIIHQQRQRMHIRWYDSDKNESDSKSCSE